MRSNWVGDLGGGIRFVARSIHSVTNLFARSIDCADVNTRRWKSSSAAGCAKLDGRANEESINWSSYIFGGCVVVSSSSKCN